MGTAVTAIGVSHCLVPTRKINGEYEKDIYISNVCDLCGSYGLFMCTAA